MVENVTVVNPALSQVASTSNSKLLSGLALGLIVMVILACIWFGGHHNSTSQKPVEKPNYDVPQTNLTSQPTTTTTEPMVDTIQTKLALEKLAQQEKFYRMRQAAPIEMYAASQEESSNPGASSAVSESYAENTSNNALALSSKDIAKLKSIMGNNDANTQFLQNATESGVEVAQASHIPHLDYTIPQGTLIPGSLQTAINSDLPGMVKATVSEDVFAGSGRRVLIPRGSTLIGQYNAGISMGQQRVFVVWTRLIRADGVDVMFGSPGTDSLGQAGLGADHLETHFWARFGQASLLSIIGGAIANAGVNQGDEYNSASAYRLALANNFQQTAGSSLLNTMNIKPTIHVDQGVVINVFVNRDLSFYQELSGN